MNSDGVRSRIPQISRTKSALIRDYWHSREYTVSQISEWLNCGPREVWYAIKNEANDNLSEDSRYLNGQLGDIINVDELPVRKRPITEPQVKLEELEVEQVDVKLCNEYDGNTSESEDTDEIEREQCLSSQSQDEQSQLNIMSPKPPPSYEEAAGPDASQVLFRAAPSRTSGADQRSAAAGRPHDGRPRLPLDPSSERVHPVVAATYASAFKGKGRELPPSVASKPSSATIPTIPTASTSQCQVSAFLSGLKRPQACLKDAFYEFGVKTDADLDVLCTLQDQWDVLKEFLMTRNVTIFQWMMVKNGLEARATHLSDNHARGGCSGIHNNIPQLPGASDKRPEALVLRINRPRKPSALTEDDKIQFLGFGKVLDSEDVEMGEVSIKLEGDLNDGSFDDVVVPSAAESIEMDLIEELQYPDNFDPPSSDPVVKAQSPPIVQKHAETQRFSKMRTPPPPVIPLQEVQESTSSSSSDIQLEPDLSNNTTDAKHAFSPAVDAFLRSLPSLSPPPAHFAQELISLGFRSDADLDALALASPMEGDWDELKKCLILDKSHYVWWTYVKNGLKERKEKLSRAGPDNFWSRMRPRLSFLS
ncbi:uncharacterized protein FIBRA_00143 [Fibroporia radiculosa]|uniref:Uncharacterized protein n=1 Tax=Fibroporia radiculosa TaxID=599839 RepID=J7S5Q6_9APHY|nr:uncharacterized protein FIBRA_00143 [Fibroporia radiculosa]CCL98149.1 predicted protein [Fibroporia radiculosa]